MIQVTATLSGPLRNHYLSGPSTKGEEIQLSIGSTVENLLDQYGIPREKAHMIVINRRKADIHTLLNAGDHVRILPLAAGG